MSQFPREELEAAFEENRKAQEREDWSAYADCFTRDAVYVEHEFGRFEGREKIREWLVPIMAQCKGWTFPEQWRVISGDRIVFSWLNRLPGRRDAGGYYEFSGVTTMIYAGNGKFSYQEDWYNYEEAKQVMQEWARDQGGRAAAKE